MKTAKKLSLAVLLGLMASPAFALLPLTAAHPGNFTFTTDGTLLPLSASGATTLRFRTTAAEQKVVIAYNAECSFASTTKQAWIGVDIIVDGVTVPPSNEPSSFDAMCTSDGTGDNNWTRAVMNAVYVVPAAGLHDIQIKATMSNGTGTGWYGDSSLIIWR